MLNKYIHLEDAKMLQKAKRAIGRKSLSASAVKYELCFKYALDCQFYSCTLVNWQYLLVYHLIVEYIF